MFERLEIVDRKQIDFLLESELSPKGFRYFKEGVVVLHEKERIYGVSFIGDNRVVAVINDDKLNPIRLNLRKSAELFIDYPDSLKPAVRQVAAKPTVPKKVIEKQQLKKQIEDEFEGL